MHFEILAEDASGKIMLEHLIPKIIDTDLHTYSIKPYKGCGSCINCTSLKNLAKALHRKNGIQGNLKQFRPALNTDFIFVYSAINQLFKQCRFFLFDS